MYYIPITSNLISVETKRNLPPYVSKAYNFSLDLKEFTLNLLKRNAKIHRVIWTKNISGSPIELITYVREYQSYNDIELINKTRSKLSLDIVQNISDKWEDRVKNGNSELLNG